jgi:hypothetical protein
MRTLRDLVHSCIREFEKDFANLVLSDFNEQFSATLAYRRRPLCEQWLHLYNRRS